VGTTVRVDLPATSDGCSEPLDEHTDALRPTLGETILLVEDEDLVREPARRILARHGYTVLAARDANQALAIVHDHPGQIDLLLTDVVMPGRSGRELSVAAREHRPSMHVLFMSGYNNAVIVHEGILDDGVHLIEKPFAADDLLRRVRDVLDESP
jgi:two-component system, cell cycle sensor histidine kinase and response regulator CckA